MNAIVTPERGVFVIQRGASNGIDEEITDIFFFVVEA
jgi:hypothetical protein